MFRSHSLKTRESLIAPRLAHINRNTTYSLLFFRKVEKLGVKVALAARP
jgi:hypothetical protein